MRLLERSNDGTFSLVEFYRNVPHYAILSHRWYAAAEEVTLADIMNGTGRDKSGYSKLTFCADYAAWRGLRYIWVDTCCIDKTNSVELQEAINSMFRWYRQSTRCYVYMSDVLHDGGTDQLFRHSAWFTRGWTLQELVAPSCVEFFDKRGTRIGDKDLLLPNLVAITGIPGPAISGDMKKFAIKHRLSWASHRITTREEDEAYCLLGICGVYMPLLYGEGLDNARRRLNREIGLSQSLFQSFYGIVHDAYPWQLIETYLPRGLTTNNLQELYLNLLVEVAYGVLILFGAIVCVPLSSMVFAKSNYVFQLIKGAAFLLSWWLLRVWFLFSRANFSGDRVMSLHALVALVLGFYMYGVYICFAEWRAKQGM